MLLNQKAFVWWFSPFRFSQSHFCTYCEVTEQHYNRIYYCFDIFLESLMALWVSESFEMSLLQPVLRAGTASKGALRRWRWCNCTAIISGCEVRWTLAEQPILHHYPRKYTLMPAWSHMSGRTALMSVIVRHTHKLRLEFRAESACGDGENISKWGFSLLNQEKKTFCINRNNAKV